MSDARTSVRLVRTLPRGLSLVPEGEVQILDAYLEAIERAQSFIYLESQYFSARPIARAIRDALDARPNLEVVLLINQNPDITAYRGWQDGRFAEYALLDHPRFGAFTLWSMLPSLRDTARRELTQVFIHSKVAVVDDAWATVGTANLDGASLFSYGDDFDSRLGRGLFGPFRNVDVNVVLLDGVDGEPATGVTRRLRSELWARHLGTSAASLEQRPASGWLTRWRDAARDNVAAMRAGSSRLPSGRVIPYVPTARPREQLRHLGVDVARSGLDLRFDPSAAEVFWSAGWMKRLLPDRLRQRRSA